MLRTRCALAILTVLFMASTAASQQLLQLDSTRRSVDRARIAALVQGGRHAEGEHVVVWFPPAFDRANAERLVRSLDPAIAAMRRLIGMHDWQRDTGQKLNYYLGEGDFIPHYDGLSGLHLAVARIQGGRAPFLHEATHELLTPRGPLFSMEFSSNAAWEESVRGRPSWLEEGFASYLADIVAGQTGFNNYPAFGLPALDRIDADCAARLGSAEGWATLPSLGVSTSPPQLYTAERATFGPVFYSCACSLSKFLVEQVGLARVINLFALIPERKVDGQIEQMTGRSISSFREEWLRAIGANR